MEIIAKVSKGSLMDQIYIPKNREGMEAGSYVVVTPLMKKIKQESSLYFYKTEELSEIKIILLKKIVSLIGSYLREYQNIIIAGSILEQGFNFNDIDIIIVTNHGKIPPIIEKEIEQKLSVKLHIISMTYKELIAGLKTDPLYQLILSKYISTNRLIYTAKKEINYKLLDLHLLKSKILPDNFDILSGKEKYNLTRNIIAIKLFIENKKMTNEILNEFIISAFKLNNIEELKNNIIEKNNFINIYKKIYNDLYIKILKGIENGSKQKKAD